MAKKTQLSDAATAVRRLTIVQLGLAGVGQTEIRKIVGVNINEVNAIVKLLRRKKRGKK